MNKRIKVRKKFDYDKVDTLVRNTIKEELNNNEYINNILNSIEFKKIIKDELELKELEIVKKEKQKAEMQEVISNAIIEAHRKEDENEKKEFKNAKLSTGQKIGQISCMIIGIIIIAIAVISFLLNIFKTIDFSLFKSLYLLLTGMLFIFLSMTIKILGKSQNVNLSLTIYSIAIALASLITSIYSVVNWGG